MDQVVLSVGECLSYQEERIRRGTPSELADQSFEQLSVVLAENPEADPVVTHGLEDEAFLRDKGAHDQRARCAAFPYPSCS